MVTQVGKVFLFLVLVSAKGTEKLYIYLNTI